MKNYVNIMSYDMSYMSTYVLPISRVELLGLLPWHGRDGGLRLVSSVSDRGSAGFRGGSAET